MTAPFWCAEAREAVGVSGADAQSYLQSQLSQDLGALAVGSSAWSLLLQPTGKVDALVRVLRVDEAEFVIEVDGGWGDAVLARLRRFLIRVKATVEPLAWAGIAVRGEAPPVAGSVPAWWGEGCGFDLLGPGRVAPEDVPAGGPEDLERARVVSGWPAMGREITEQTIPAELGPLLDVAVSFTKGCYPGQELVERMDSRGASAPRVVRRLEAAEVLPADAVVRAGDREVGRVTSAAGDQALVLLSRTVEPGAEVFVAAVPARVLPLH